MSAERLVDAGTDASPHCRAYSARTTTSTSVFKPHRHPGRFFHDTFSASHSREHLAPPLQPLSSDAGHTSSWPRPPPAAWGAS